MIFYNFILQVCLFWFFLNYPSKNSISLLTFSLRILQSTLFHFGELTNGMNMRWADSLKTGSDGISNNMVPYAIPLGAHRQPSKWKNAKGNAASLQLPQVTDYVQKFILHTKYLETLGHIQDQRQGLFGLLITSQLSYRFDHMIAYVVSVLVHLQL